jgi:quercetin dioxygenase-like cupin family protein
MMKAVVVAPGEGRFIAVGSAGTGVTVKASGAETGDLCTVWEGRVPPGTVGAGPHYHRGRDEFFYVLEGELVLRVGNERHTAGAGTFAFIPRETIHGFHNASSESATLLVMHHPAGFERFFEEMQQLAARHGGREERAALAARFDMIPVPAPTET